jgi:hypothetical protein
MTSSNFSDSPEGDLSSSEVDALAKLASATDFLRRAPIFVTAQAYRSESLKPGEIANVQDHLESWRGLLKKHGVNYDGILVNNESPSHVDLIYHGSIHVQTEAQPAALPLVLDALYELSTLLPEAEFELYTVETVVTRLSLSNEHRGVVAGSRIFPQLVYGFPAQNERAAVFAANQVEPQ